MKITKIDNIPGHIGVVTHDSDIEPILIKMSEQERFILANSPHHGRATIFHPDTMSHREACDIIEGKPHTLRLPPGSVKLDSRAVSQVSDFREKLGELIQSMEEEATVAELRADKDKDETRRVHALGKKSALNQIEEFIKSLVFLDSDGTAKGA